MIRFTYLKATRFAAEEESLRATTIGKLLHLAIFDAQKLETKQDYKTGAWMLRDLFVANLTHNNGTATTTLKVQTPRSIVASIKNFLDVKDCKYHLKTYKHCFVGSKAVAMLVDANLVDSREDAMAKLEQIQRASMIHHVERAHGFEDSYLFYRFATDNFQDNPEFLLYL